jgi:hypothetical protein
VCLRGVVSSHVSVSALEARRLLIDVGLVPSRDKSRRPSSPLRAIVPQANRAASELPTGTWRVRAVSRRPALRRKRASGRRGRASRRGRTLRGSRRREEALRDDTAARAAAPLHPGYEACGHAAESPHEEAPEKSCRRSRSLRLRPRHRDPPTRSAASILLRVGRRSGTCGRLPSAERAAARRRATPLSVDRCRSPRPSSRCMR